MVIETSNQQQNNKKWIYYAMARGFVRSTAAGPLNCKGVGENRKDKNLYYQKTAISRAILVVETPN
jgi:hypothetical protein